MTVAVCHSVLRRSVAAGDVVIFLACRERSPRIQPPAFRGALYALPAGVRVVLGILRVTLVETAAAYHGENENRLDKWYRPCRGRERAVCTAPGSRRFTLRYRVRFGPGPRPLARDHHLNMRHLRPQWHCFLAQRRAVAARADPPADFGELHFWRWMAGPRCEIFERQSARRGVQVFAGTHRRPADERALKSAVAVGIFGASWVRRFDNRLLQSIFLGPNGLRHATFPMSTVAVGVLGHWAPRASPSTLGLAAAKFAANV